MHRVRRSSSSSGSPGQDAAGTGKVTGEAAHARWPWLQLPQLRVACLAIAMLAALSLVACAGTSARFSPMPGKSFPPKDESFEVAVFESVLPPRDFERIARLDVRMQMPAAKEASLQDAMAELKRQARRAGADAIIDIRLQRSKAGEMTLFQVSAMGIRYPPPAQ